MPRRLWLFSAVATVLAGCNQGPSLKTYPVTGTVTYDGKPVAGATVSYVSKAVDAPKSSGVTDSDGRFSLATYVGPTQVLRGAAPGDYQVAIIKQTVDTPGASAEGENMENMTPEQRQEMMSKMWQKQRAGSPGDKRPPEVPKPKSEIPLKYANPEKSGLSATVVVGENEPRDFKLSDE